MIKVAAAVLVKHPVNNLFLAIRKHGSKSWGLPCGKSNVGEFSFDCAARELKEETSLQMLPGDDLIYLYSQRHNEFTVDTWLFKTPRQTFDVCDSCEGEVAWVSKEDLCEGIYGDYNKAMFNFVAKKGPAL